MARLNVEQLESRCVPALMYSVSGLVVIHTDTGDTGFRPFEANAAQVPLFTIQDGGTLWIGAGIGGGPRLQARSSTYPYNILSDRFVGDEGSRTGVSVSLFNQGVATGIPSSTIPVLVDPAAPGATAQVLQEIQRVPSVIQSRLAATGYTVYSHSAPGVGWLPEFAQYHGVQTQAQGDGSRTWDDVPSATLFYVDSAGAVTPLTFVRQDSPQHTIHEVGHAVEEALVKHNPPRDAWITLWSLSTWSTDYDRLNEQEAFADSFAAWIRGDPAQPAVTTYFNSLGVLR